MGKGDRTNPYVGRKGFWNRWNRFTYNFSGAAQVGTGGRSERALQPPTEHTCPMCGRPMAEHEIERGNGRTPTRIHCPA